MTTTQQLLKQFVGAQAHYDITDPRSGEVIVESGAIVTEQQSSWLALLVAMEEYDLGEVQDALTPPVAVGEVQDALTPPPLPQPPWCVYEDDEGVPCGKCRDCERHMAEVSWQ